MRPGAQASTTSRPAGRSHNVSIPVTTVTLTTSATTPQANAGRPLSRRPRHKATGESVPARVLAGPRPSNDQARPPGEPVTGYNAFPRTEIGLFIPPASCLDHGSRTFPTRPARTTTFPTAQNGRRGTCIALGGSGGPWHTMRHRTLPTEACSTRISDDMPETASLVAPSLAC